MPQDNTTLIGQTGYLGARASLQKTWDETIRYRALFLSIVHRELILRYRHAFLGIAWIVVQQGCFTVLFSSLLGHKNHFPSGNIPYPVFTLAALILWQFFFVSATEAAETFPRYAQIISKVYLPLILLPLAIISTHLVDFGVSIALFIGIASYYHVSLAPHFLWLTVFLAFTFLTTIGTSFFVSVLVVKYRDAKYVMPFLFQALLFASPVSYSSQIIPPTWASAYYFNPLAGIIEGFRWALFSTSALPPMIWISLTTAVIFFLFGYLYFEYNKTYIVENS